MAFAFPTIRCAKRCATARAPATRRCQTNDESRADTAPATHRWPQALPHLRQFRHRPRATQVRRRSSSKPSTKTVPVRVTQPNQRTSLAWPSKRHATDLALRPACVGDGSAPNGKRPSSGSSKKQPRRDFGCLMPKRTRIFMVSAKSLV